MQNWLSSCSCWNNFRLDWKKNDKIASQYRCSVFVLHTIITSWVKKHPFTKRRSSIWTTMQKEKWNNQQRQIDYIYLILKCTAQTYTIMCVYAHIHVHWRALSQTSAQLDGTETCLYVWYAHFNCMHASKVNAMLKFTHTGVDWEIYVVKFLAFNLRWAK